LVGTPTAGKVDLFTGDACAERGRPADMLLQNARSDLARAQPFRMGGANTRTMRLSTPSGSISPKFAAQG